MRKVLIIAACSVIVALLNVGFSYIGYVELIWVGALALVLLEREVMGIVFVILSGFLYDVMLLGEVGVTGLSGLVGILAWVIAKGLGVADRAWQMILWVIVVLFISFMVEALMRNILVGQPLGLDLFDYWLKGVLLNVVLVFVVFLSLQRYMERTSTKSKVKI